MKRFQFSLRTLLLAVFIAAVGCVVVPRVWHKLFPPRIEPFGHNLSLIWLGGQEVHEKAADLSPEEYAKLQAQIEQATDESEHASH
jgi:hypothetical protein